MVSPFEVGYRKGSFFCWRTGDHTYTLEGLDSIQGHSFRQSILQWLDQMTFSESLTVTDLTSTQRCLWELSDATNAELTLREWQCSANPSGSLTTRASDTFLGRAWSTIWGSVTDLQPLISQTTHSTEILAALSSARIQSGFAFPERELTSSSNPLELGMTAWIAENKGCYPGQEVIERIISQGSPAKRLVRLEMSAPTPPSSPLTLSLLEPSGHKEVGKLTSAADNLALALVGKVFAKTGVTLLLSQSEPTKPPIECKVTSVVEWQTP